MSCLVRLLEPDRLPRELIVRLHQHGQFIARVKVFRFVEDQDSLLRRTALRQEGEPPPRNGRELGLLEVISDGTAHSRLRLKWHATDDVNIRQEELRNTDDSGALDQIKLKLDGNVPLIVRAEVEREVILRPVTRRGHPEHAAGVGALITRGLARVKARLSSAIRGLNYANLLSLLLAVALLGALWGRMGPRQDDAPVGSPGPASPESSVGGASPQTTTTMEP